MTTEQQRKMLECAAKACGPEYQYDELEHCWYKETDDDYFGNPEWNPLTNPADCAAMCAELYINTRWISDNELSYVKVFNGFDVSSAFIRDHGNSRLKAWMFAATMVAAKIGGMK